ncbi:MAG TPA: hypothetical protein VF473_07660 [Cyclobacteriaceae bacterium]
MSIEPLKQVLIIPVVLLYLLAALEVNIGSQFQTFGDEYDTYISDQKSSSKAVCEISKEPVQGPDLYQSIVFSSSFSRPQTPLKVREIIYSLHQSRIPLRLKVSCLVI